MALSTYYTIGSILLISVASFAGVFLLAFSKDILKKIVFWLVSFATGAILGNVFFHLLPEATEVAGNPDKVFLYVFVGVLASFILEKFIRWHHCHHIECDEHVHPAGIMIMAGDAVHNILDGILIASAYMVDLQLGMATTLAVLLHEIPQEISDFSVLIHSGYSVAKALIWNFVSALVALVGAFIVFGLQQSIEGIEVILLALAAGNFLYIALADLIPELHKESRLSKATLQLVFIILGGLLLFSLSQNEHPHGHEKELFEEHGTEESAHQ